MTRIIIWPLISKVYCFIRLTTLYRDSVVADECVKIYKTSTRTIFVKSGLARFLQRGRRINLLHMYVYICKNFLDFEQRILC